RLCFVCIETLHARKPVVNMKNTPGGQFYLFQARRGGPTSGQPTTHPNTGAKSLDKSHCVY
ncbi:MAG: hypothetical protein WAU67_12695, partial [Terracidiphilus sp.]